MLWVSSNLNQGLELNIWLGHATTLKLLGKFAAHLDPTNSMN
jgi:hypothetical protein